MAVVLLIGGSLRNLHRSLQAQRRVANEDLAQQEKSVVVTRRMVTVKMEGYIFCRFLIESRVDLVYGIAT